MSRSTSVDVAERVLRLLDEGRYTATYKQAVLVALLDLCLEATERDGSPPQTLTTRQVAEKVVALYWPHTRPWVRESKARILVQNAAGSRSTRERGGGLVARIRDLREQVEKKRSGTSSLAGARAVLPTDFRRLVDDVEWTLVKMPLPKLQRIGQHNTEWLYTLGFRDEDERDPLQRAKPRPNEGQVRAYQRELHGERLAPNVDRDFDNRIHLQPGVAEAFARLHALLRPFILRHWTEQVVRLNDLRADDVAGFLFGREREDLEPVRAPLVELQRGRCFYCEGALASDVHVDHFIPWARHPDDGLHNLVAADARCNLAKKDYFASVRHVERWRARSLERREALERIAIDHAWESDEARTIGVARAIYLALPDDMPLWCSGRRFERADPAAVRRALAA